MLSINKFLEKTMAYFIPFSVVIGVLVSDYIVDFAWLIPWIFAFMTFAGSLNSNFASFKDAVLHPLPIFVTFTILHIVMPLLSFCIGHLVFPGEMLTITGLVLAMAIPTGITSFVWVAVAKGNNALALTIILLGALLSPVIVPLTLHLLVGETVEINALGMMLGLLWTIVIPSIVGMILNQVSKGKVVDILSARLSPFSKVGMGLVVMLNGAVVAPFLLEEGLSLIGLGVVVIIIAFLGYVLSFSAGRLLKQGKETIIAMVFTGGMRNISAGVVLATAYFPPAVAIPVVLGMLFQQVLASLFHTFIKRYYIRINL